MHGHLSTLLAHAGCETDPATGALTPPLYLNATFERDEDLEYSRGYIYSRWGNPTRTLLEESLARLEVGAESAVAAQGFAFSSGMAAASGVLQCLRPGDHVVLAADVYHGVRHLLQTTYGEWGLSHTEVDQTDLSAVAKAMRPETKLVWAETPSNPNFKITDIRGLAEIAHAGNAALLVDGTWTTPLLQQPLLLGADLVLHSATKYLGGHSDVLLGAVIAREDWPLRDRLLDIMASAGPVADPFACWLVLRGLRSLGARMPLHCRNAAELATWLEDHEGVIEVFYPGLASHPHHELASKQMSGFGGMIGFRVTGGRERALSVVKRCQLFRRSTSLGGTESLIEHRASIEAIPGRVPDDLLRASVGLEHIDDLKADLAQALEAGV